MENLCVVGDVEAGGHTSRECPHTGKCELEGTERVRQPSKRGSETRPEQIERDQKGRGEEMEKKKKKG